MNWINKLLKLFFLLSFLSCSTKIWAQRNYATNSVLASGNWYKLATTQEGIYKIDASFLSNLGISINNLTSTSIRLYSNGNFLPTEKNSEPRIDDLQELAIEVVDGGDGFFNSNDYFLFYAPPVDVWQKDSLNKRFVHEKNLYSDSVFYFLTIGGNGKRVATKNTTLPATVNVNTFNERYFYETDKINFLNSGKEWLGEEFSSLPGNSNNKNFTVNWNGLDVNYPLYFSTSFAARSIGATSTLNIGINNLLLSPTSLAAVSGNYLDDFATLTNRNFSVNANSGLLNIQMNFIAGNAAAQGWLNWFELHGRRSLEMNNQSQFFFRDWQSVAINSIANFTISGSNTSTTIWEITNQFQPQKVQSSFNLNQTNFLNDASVLREYVAFNNGAFLIPIQLGKINLQNLHNSNFVNYIIVTHPLFLAEANRLAQFHQQQNGYTTKVATTQEIYNEFSGGVTTPVAIRDFVKMFYDKAANDTTKQPQYLLLFGAASFDYKNRINNNTNLVPSYQSLNALNPLISYTSDDFFGLLNDEDDVNLISPPSLLDIAIGRLPVTSIVEAKNVVDKIINYHANSSLGSWRNNTTFIADDKDGNVHLNDAEFITNNALTANPLFNQEKIYLDAFPLISGTGGGRYPLVNSAIVNSISNGSLIVNYSGHGGYQRLADEAVFGQEEANQLNNANKLPLMITATCDFAPYDDPTKKSLGSSLLVGNKTGAIGLVTTTRIVFAYSNRILNNNFLKVLFTPKNQQAYFTLGEAFKIAKNYTYQTFSDVNNNRKFTLLGDPGIKISFPEMKMELTEINAQPIIGLDTLKALGKYVFSGRILDFNGTTANNFNGTVYPTIFDKMQSVQTLGNDAASPIATFNQQKNIIYKGKATVNNGLFSFSFIVPKDINYQVGNGKISLYANNASKDANGTATNFYIGGTSNTANADVVGPTIKAYLNDEKFVNGGLVNENPILLLQLFDSSGINTVGTGIGHDITVTIDGEDKNSIVLNNFYEANTDSYQSGNIRYQLPNLTNGIHYLKIKAWDVANNSTETIVELMVQQKEALQISHVLNYPNPFTSKTNFWFEHNQPNSGLKVLINIFSITGKLVHQIQRNVSTIGNIVNDIEWDGKDKNSEKLARGVYIYRIIVVNSAGLKAEATQKLYLL